MARTARHLRGHLWRTVSRARRISHTAPPHGVLFDSRYLYFSTFHWHRLINGNSGFLPPSYLQFIEKMHDFPGDAALDYLRARGVEYVTVHGAFFEEGFPEVVEGLSARRDLEFLSSAALGRGESRLYRFQEMSL